MSKLEIDSDGFQKVKSKRYSKNKPIKIPTKELHFEKQDVSVDVDKVIE